MREVYVGFDSAWTDNQKNPGALAALVIENGKISQFIPPELVTFGQASDHIERLQVDADYVLIALDQPTLVPNHNSCRPVDRVAGSLVNRIGGGVQPANRSKSKMFGDAAPVWPFLERIGARENPCAAREASEGRFLIEVFPALALPSMIDLIWDRKRAAKYNPGNRAKFDMADWKLVTLGVADFAARLGFQQVQEFATEYQGIPQPTKADQDRLDALICLAIALAWRTDKQENSAVIGDGETGYMVTPVSPRTRTVLTLKALECSVPIDAEWPNDAVRTIASFPKDRPENAEKREPRPASNVRSTPGKPTKPGNVRGRQRMAQGRAVVDDRELRAFLISVACQQRTVTYGDVAAHFGHPWTQGFGASLIAALNQLGSENKESGQPLLMALVVNASEGLPGIGYCRSAGIDHLPERDQRDRHQQEVEAIWAYPWHG